MNRLEHEIMLVSNQINRFEETFIHCSISVELGSSNDVLSRIYVI